MRTIVAVCAIALNTFIAMPLMAQQGADLKKPLVVNGKTYTYKEGMPYVERGELKNKQPEPKREPSPAEKVVTKVMQNPVAPAIVDGKLGVQYTKKTP